MSETTGQVHESINYVKPFNGYSIPNGPSGPKWPDTKRPDTMPHDGFFVLGHVGHRTALAAQARPTRTGRWPRLARHYPPLSPPLSLRQDLHGCVGAAVVVTSSQIRTQGVSSREGAIVARSELRPLRPRLRSHRDWEQRRSARPPGEWRYRWRNRAEFRPHGRDSADTATGGGGAGGRGGVAGRGGDIGGGDRPRQNREE
jgi:hypothetical protein